MRLLVLAIALGGCGRWGFDSDPPATACMLALDAGAPRLNFNSSRPVQSSGTELPIAWSITGPAKIDALGTVGAGDQPGTATITATDDAGCEATATLEIGGDTLWYVGGSSMSVPSAQIWTSTDGLAWTLTGTLPDKRTSGGIYVFHDRLWLLGGSDGSGMPRTFWSTADGVTWRQDIAVIAAVNFGAVVFDDKMWSIGGDASPDTARVLATSDGQTWTDMGVLPQVNHGGSAVVAGGKMWWLGGHNRTAGTLQNWALSSTDGATWTMEGTIGPGREYAGAVALGDTLVLAGGQDLTPTPTNVVSTSDDASVAFAAGSPLPAARAFGALVRFGDSLWSIGGSDGGGVFSAPVGGGAWTARTTNFPIPRQGGRVAVFSVP